MDSAVLERQRVENAHEVARRVCSGVILSATVKPEPFPWFYAVGAFPLAFYERMLWALPKAETYTPTDYGARFFCTPETMQSGFWGDAAQWLCDDVAEAAMALFLPQMRARFKGSRPRLMVDARLIMDRDGYEIWPHTDHPDKVISLLFYLARDETMADCGTAFYEPLDPAFSCDGKKRHSFEGFREVSRAPFLPNSVLGFFKTPKAFHGVPAIQRPDMRRDLLLVNVYDTSPGRELAHLYEKNAQ